MNTRHHRLHAIARACILAGACSAGACQQTNETAIDPLVGGGSSNVGLFTPGSTLGTVRERGAGDGGMPAAPTGDRCVGASGTAGTPCMLTVTFTTTPVGEHWGPANVGAVWIEDGAGTYIKTIERWAAIRSRSLYNWTDHSCFGSWPEVDAVSQATLPDHNSQHIDIWDGKDFKGSLVPDGTYRVFIEVTETETNYGPMGMVEFQKGASASTLQLPDMAPYKGLTLDYMPAAPSSDEPVDAGQPPAGGGGADASVANDAGNTLGGAASSGATAGGEPGLDAGPMLTP